MQNQNTLTPILPSILSTLFPLSHPYRPTVVLEVVLIHDNSIKNQGRCFNVSQVSQVYFIATFKTRKRKQRKTIQSPRQPYLCSITLNNNITTSVTCDDNKKIKILNSTNSINSIPAITLKY